MRRLLIVDDDPLIINFLSDALTSPAWEVASASDAMSAFLIARDKRPFMIVTDVQMPAFGSGTDMVKALRQEKATALTPVLVLTGLAPERAQPMLPQNDPRIRLMSKPPDIDAIFRHIYEMTGVNGAPEPTPLTDAPTEIAPEQTAPSTEIQAEPPADATPPTE